MGYDPTYFCGFSRITTSGVIGDSGKPVLVAGYSVDASGGGASTPYFINGTAASAGNNVAFRAQTTATSQSQTQSIPLPVMLGSGCFVSFDANTTAVTVFYMEGA